MYNKFLELSLNDYSKREIDSVDILFTLVRYDKIDFKNILTNTGYNHTIKERKGDSIVVNFIKSVGEIKWVQL